MAIFRRSVNEMDMSKCPFAYNGLIVSELQKWTFGHVHFDVHSALNVIDASAGGPCFSFFCPRIMRNIRYIGNPAAATSVFPYVP